MSSVAADATNNASCEVLTFGAVVLSVTDLATILAGLVFVVAKRSVESSKLTKLVTLQLVLAFGD